MNLIPPRLLTPALFLFLLQLNVPVRAQTGVWNETQKSAAAASKRLDKGKGTIKRWKDHIQDWGVDTSYTRAVNIGGKLNTNGWSGLVSYEQRVKAGQRRFYQLSFSEIKHEKQVKQERDNADFPQLGASTPFVFGKINNLYVLQLGLGKEQLLLPGVLEGNISVSFRYQAGISVAMLKPYYLKLIHVEYTPDPVATLNEEQYSASNSALFLKTSSILGASKWSKGLDEIEYVPGGYLEAAFTIQPGKAKTLIQTVLLGGNFSVYSKKLPIMAERTAYQWQGCLFVGLMVGKRW